jgi:hypothetical protein
VEIEIGAASANVGLLIDQDDDFKALDITKDGVGAGDAIAVLNSGTGRGLFIDQDGAAVAIEVDSEATGSPLLSLAGINANSRGDIAFGTARTGDPSAPSEGDIWYNSTDKNLYIRTDAASIDLTQQDTQNTLDEAYDEGGAGAGRTIIADTGAVQITGSAQALLDLDQSGAFAALDFACGAAAGLIGTQANNSAMVDLTKTGTGAGTMLTFENDGTGDTMLLDVDGAAKGLVIDSEAVDDPLIELAPITGNARGDIAFGTARTAEPSGYDEGDLWYDGTLERLSFGTSIATHGVTAASRYFGGETETSGITIATGVATITRGRAQVSAEGGPGADTLDTLNSTPQAQQGDIVVLSATSGHTITVSHGSGNILLDGAANKTLDSTSDTLMLMWDGSNWVQLAFSNNA